MPRRWAKSSAYMYLLNLPILWYSLPDGVFSESVDIVHPFLAGLPCDHFFPCILQLVIGAVHYVVMEAANVSCPGSLSFSRVLEQASDLSLTQMLVSLYVMFSFFAQYPVWFVMCDESLT